MSSIICMVLLGQVFELSDKIGVHVTEVIDDRNVVLMLNDTEEPEIITRSWVKGLVVRRWRVRDNLIWLQAPTAGLEQGEWTEKLKGRFLVRDGSRVWRGMTSRGGLPFYRLVERSDEGEAKKAKREEKQLWATSFRGGMFHRLSGDVVYVSMSDDSIKSFSLKSVSKEDREWIIDYFKRHKENPPTDAVM